MVFELIKKLTKAEKRYFMLLSNHYKVEDSRYLKLYQYVADNEVYNDEKIKEHFKKEPWIKHYTMVKSYLYDKLLTTLRLFHEDEFENSDFTKTHQNIQIFEWKGLRKNQQKEWRKLEKHLKKTDNWDPQRIIFFNKLSRSIEINGESAISEKGYKKRTELLDDFEEITQNLLDYIQLRKLSLMMRKGFYDKKEEMVETAWQSSILEELNPNYDLRAQLMYYRIQYYYHQFHNETQKGLEAWKKIVDLLEAHPKKNDAVFNYFYVLATYLEFLLSFQKFEEFDQYYPKFQKHIKQLKIDSEKYRAGFINQYLLISRTIQEGENEKAIKLFEKGSNKFPIEEAEKYMSGNTLLYFYLIGGQAYLLEGKFDQLNDVCHHISNGINVSNWLEGGSIFHIYQLIAFYETKYKYFSHELEKKKYFFKKHNLYKDTIQVLWEFFNELHKKYLDSEKQIVFEKYHFYLQKLEDKKYKPFVDWMEHAIEKIQGGNKRV